MLTRYPPPLPRVPHNISGGTLAADQGGKFALHLDLKAFPWRFGMDGHAMEQSAETGDEWPQQQSFRYHLRQNRKFRRAG